ncbi:glycosyltransferase family 4 protein [Coniophora puteana RWD-64-598 SS2]|uniref:GDP-Man:Man(3)GlcNAc(2)-PP-Dol alpha-1,2-mannosyltransferase n=1 Tax=Coniophora puteana (strain RWD-64-598) TaxID=741705 RepID=A0A5M3MQV1_CONPW|nr:glycosyltransferase family 4 protein [Coniophora puteana RWD-64-598 SS2]EIW81552.1 glycosyltransferase family 4 protein [Coniophora puteana RWD-64-598 SS2]
MLTAFVLAALLPVLLSYTAFASYRTTLQAKDKQHRQAVLRALSVPESEWAGKKFIGFFHPYCNAGGGGERVLWTAIARIQAQRKNIINVVYTGDTDASKEEIIAKVEARFDITLDPASLHFVFCDSRKYVEDAAWPRFTLLGQSLGSMYLAWEAMTKLVPDLYIDTMGYAFTFHVVRRLGGCPVGAYVHYPTISTDMLARVRERKQGHTNSDAISGSAVLSTGKLWYYRLTMYYYALSLRSASFLMANSTWTKAHVDAILSHSDPLLSLLHTVVPPLALLQACLAQPPKERVTKAQIAYPPCDTREMERYALEGRERVVLSVAQFRPEKDHAAQLRAFAELLEKHAEYRPGQPSAVKLVLLGGSRNAGDSARVEGLRELAKSLGIDDSVSFVLNAPYPTMLAHLARASVGLSTMVDEHFGINVVEMMAAGAIPVAHASAGPLLDIVVPFEGKSTGFHATTPSTFADALHAALTLPPAEDLALRQRARQLAVSKFSEDAFWASWEKGWAGFA